MSLPGLARLVERASPKIQALIGNPEQLLVGMNIFTIPLQGFELC